MENLHKISMLIVMIIVALSSMLKFYNQSVAQEEWYMKDNMRIDKRTGIPVAIYDIDSRQYSGTPEQIARQYLIENKAILGMTENLVDLELLEVKESPAGYHVGFRQVYEKIPVWRSEIVVSINHQNRVVMVINGYKPNISINNIPTINQEKVLQLAKKELNLTKEEFLEPPTAELLVFPDSVSHLHLVWHVKMYPLNPDGAWRLLIDAHTGEVLEKADIRIYYTNGEGRTWDPDPVTKLQNNGLTDQDDSNYFSDSDYAIRTLQELNNAVGGVYRIQGRYARSEQLEGENPTLAQESNPLNFKYYRNNKKFEEVNVYYHIDKQRRYVGTLGFSPSWNGNTWIKFDAHGTDQDNSWYNPDPTKRYLIFGNGYVDDGEDQDVPQHEYSHALHDALMPGGTYGAGSDMSGISEGMGDYLAVSYRRTLSSFNPDRVFPWDGTAPWGGRWLNDTYVYPTDWTGWGIYHKGTLWASTLMDIEESSVGRNVITKLMLTSLSYLTKNSNVIDNVYAIFRADRDVYNGSHLQTLVLKFRNRGFFYGNTVSGTISSNTTWSLYKLIIGNVTVNSGVTLTISSGAFIFFDPGTKLTINGSLTANGSSNQVITFQSSSGTWYGIELNYCSGITLKYCTIQNSSYGVRAYFTPLYVENCSFTSNSTSIKYDNQAGGYVKNSTISSSGSYGIQCSQNSNPTLRPNNRIWSNYTGVYGDYSSLPELGTLSVHGENSIKNNSCMDVWSENSNTVYAQYNYWVSSSPDPNVSDNVVWQPYLTSDPTGGGLLKPLADNVSFVLDNPAADTTGKSEFGKAYLVYLSGDYATALVQFKALVTKYPETAAGLQGLALTDYCYQHLDNAIASLSYLDQVGVSYAGKAISGLAQSIAVGHLVKLGNYQEAIARSQQILQAFPDKDLAKYALYDLGTIYWFFLADQKIGESYYRQLIAKYPDDDLSISALATLGEWQPGAQPKPEPPPLLTDEHQVPTEFRLEQNYPNPFNAETLINYQLPAASTVTVQIYNLLGQKFRTLVDEDKATGSYSVIWDGKDGAGLTVASGIYVYVITAGEFRDLKKMVLVR